MLALLRDQSNCSTISTRQDYRGATCHYVNDIPQPFSGRGWTWKANGTSKNEKVLNHPATLRLEKGPMQQDATAGG